MTISREDAERVTAACREAGIAKLAPTIVSLAKPCVKLVLHKMAGEPPVIGKTRVGGAPDLPLGFEWPRWKGRPLSFLAQIELEALAGFTGTEILPSDGLLSFFYDPLQKTWGFDPKDAGSWHVIWIQDKNLAPRSLPPDLPQEGRFEACTVTFSQDVSLPPWDSMTFKALKLRKAQKEGYFKVEDRLRGEADLGTSSLLLGHPDAIQGDMQLECSLVTNGLYCGDASGYDDPRRKVFAQQAPSWRLLFQLASEDEAAMMWGDVGCLYFWIHERDLKERRFEKVWMILQCG
jgi:uncharacterized protein YwqG